MPLSTLGNTIIDSLVPVIDSIRGAIHPVVGDRQYQVDLVVRRWSGTQRGEGTASIFSTLRITPQPKVSFDITAAAPTNLGVHYDLRPQGKEEEGGVILTEVSLTYSEAELLRGQAAQLGATDEFYYKLTDAYGQGIGPRYYVLSAPPRLDKDMDMAWVLLLRRVEIE